MNVAFYFTHCETLGHTTRVFALAEGMKNMSLLLLQGGKSLVYKPDFATVDLPHPFYSKNVFSGKKCIPTKQHVIERIKAMYESLAKFEPSVFITEYFPFGREDCSAELLPILCWLRKKGVKLYASIGYPVVSMQAEMLEHYCALFDALLVHTPEEYDFVYLLRYLRAHGMESTASWYEKFFDKYKEKIIFTGYVVSPSIHQSYWKKEKNLVLLSRGGGVIYPKMIAYGLRIAKLFSDKHFVCVAGPATSQKEDAIFSSLAGKYGVEYHLHLPTLAPLLAASTASINMAGYGTVVQLLYLGTRSVLVCREKENNRFYIEQRYRAFMAEQLGFGKVISYEGITTTMLAEALNQVLLLNPKPLPASCFDGTTKTVQVIKSAFS